MSELLISYVLFLLKGVTAVVLLMVLIGFIISMKGKKDKSAIQFEHLNQKRLTQKKSTLEQFSKSGSKAAIKALRVFTNTIKSRKKLEKSNEKLRKRSFVLSFNGDTSASQVKELREEITTLLDIANANDEVLVKMESPGGSVPEYGLVAAQLIRIKQAKLKLTVCVDKVAASGGYLASVVADRILAAPFAYIGSIGVVVMVPNLHDFLKKKDVDIIELTAGKYKRSLSTLGKCTEQGKKHTREKMQAIHDQFKDLVTSYRPQIDIDSVASGEYWTAKTALSLGLIDDLMPSDTYVAELIATSEVWEVTTPKKKTLKSMIKESSKAILDVLLEQVQKANTLPR